MAEPDKFHPLNTLKDAKRAAVRGPLTWNTGLWPMRPAGFQPAAVGNQTQLEVSGEICLVPPLGCRRISDTITP